MNPLTPFQLGIKNKFYTLLDVSINYITSHNYVSSLQLISCFIHPQNQQFESL